MNRRYTTYFLFSIFVCTTCFFENCSSEENHLNNVQTKTNLSNENILVIGKDTLMLYAIDSMVCEVFHHHDNTGRFKSDKIKMFEASKNDTINIHGYTNYYDPFFNDCYDDCECYFLDTTADHKVNFITVSRYLGETSPDKLIKNFEDKFEFLSPSGTYSISTLRFSAFCPDGKCQWHWSMGHPELSFNDELKSDIRKNFKKDTYLVLKTVVAADEKGNYVRIHSNLCWHNR